MVILNSSKNVMCKEEQKVIFEHALEVAVKNAETKLGRSVPHRFEIEIQGSPTKVLQKDEAFDAIYLGPDRFYRIIDLAVIRVSKDTSTVFMCVSGHNPGTWDQTWNQPTGCGPFKQILANEIKLV